MKIKAKSRKSILATNIVARRKAKGWTQLDLAEAADLGVNTIKQIETDTSASSSLSRIAIATALGCMPDDLYQKPIATTPEPDWVSMTQKQLVDVIVSLQDEIDYLKKRIQVSSARE